MKKLVTPYHEIHKIKPASDKCWIFFFFAGSKTVLESAKESAHIIQCQTHLHSHVLVIPLVDFSLPLSWQQFPLPLVPLGPSLLHIFLGCSSSNKAMNTCGISVSEAPVARSVSWHCWALGCHHSAFVGASVSLCGASLYQLLRASSLFLIIAYWDYLKFHFHT